jgi:hypothetical protein
MDYKRIHWPVSLFVRVLQLPDEDSTSVDRPSFLPSRRPAGVTYCDSEGYRAIHSRCQSSPHRDVLDRMPAAGPSSIDIPLRWWLS